MVQVRGIFLTRNGIAIGIAGGCAGFPLAHVLPELAFFFQAMALFGAEVGQRHDTVQAAVLNNGDVTEAAVPHQAQGVDGGLVGCEGLR